MRKSKSNPAKYTRNYRKISQRHMTGYGDTSDPSSGATWDNFDEKEQKRLESVLKNAERTWKRGLGLLNDEGDESLLVGGKRKRSDKSKSKSPATENDSDPERDSKEGGMLSLLSPELREQFSGMSENNLVILPGGGKKNMKKKELPPLTPAEIKAAKALYKNTQRKLAQLEQRKRQKELRSTLYKELEENSLLTPANGAVCGANNLGVGWEEQTNNIAPPAAASNKITPQEARSLLLKSSELGKKLSKKQKLKQLHQKEALGLELTKEEMDLLYDKYEAPLDETFAAGTMNAAVNQNTVVVESGLNEDASSFVSRGKKKKAKKYGKSDSNVTGINAADPCSRNVSDGFVEASPMKVKHVDANLDQCEVTIVEHVKERDNTTGAAYSSPNNHDVSKSTLCPDTALKSGKSYAQMMLASLSSLKNKTDSRNVELADEKARKQQEEEEDAMRVEEEERKRRKAYVPSDTIKVSTMHRYYQTVDAPVDTKTSRADDRNVVLNVNRPTDVKESRYDLPVSAMEYEIIDAVRSNDCTILCGETGSGKSTQVPQFLYEAGFSIPRKNGNKTNNQLHCDQHLLIGITQPRRVAAVSTAKRVCYEMGHGDGQTIRSSRHGADAGKGNLVAYQTRYETAGLGISTHIKFMTDGILLQEIQSDLLLRKYGAIVIDEAHERNLNTDVLLGLLSVALPLRRKAAEEGSLPPLKLVIMSATLRVEDFTENNRLFPKGEDGVRRQPALVKVPGRTFPVSIHHSKVTELDDYEKACLEKTCKIHRKLPPGGILVFLTGKQEVLRMVNRLKQRLEPRDNKKSESSKRSLRAESSLEECPVSDALDGFRDMDDEEIDGDLFQKAENDDVDEFKNTDEDDNVTDLGPVDNEKKPKKVRILPLFSMLSTDEQSRVFSPVPDDTRLIVVATNIAETSITIPGISYVVDCGRQKCRNYHASTGVSSYDVMWISKAAADQRAGRAGRTGPGHCYRLYSSSVYSRYLDEFALPEVLTRPLEDVVLAMKTMNVSNVANFPFPTPPEKSQIMSAVRLLANLGCVDVSEVEEHGGDGKITSLGAAVAKLPLGVRYGKMLLVAAHANVLDYGIALVAILSESNPFIYRSEEVNEDSKLPENAYDTLKGLDEVDRHNTVEKNQVFKSKWIHDGGDVLSALMALGAYTYAGRRTGGLSEKVACCQFCEENGLNFVVMQRISKMRSHLCKLAKMRLPKAKGVAVETGTYLSSMPPPERLQECLLRQTIASGLLDNVARRAPPGVLPPEFSSATRSAYICGNTSLREPLFIDNNSVLHSKLPEWICFDSVVRKKRKDGTTVVIMQRVTPIDPEWLSSLCHGSSLMSLGSALATPLPRYTRETDSIQCAVETKFGCHSWMIPPLYVDMYPLIQGESKEKQNSAAIKDDSFRWFARYLLEGKILEELTNLSPLLNDDPSIITRRKPLKKVTLFVFALSSAGVDSSRALQKHWAEKDDKFLFKQLKPWVKSDCVDNAKDIWITAVTRNVQLWKRTNG